MATTSSLVLTPHSSTPPLAPPHPPTLQVEGITLEEDSLAFLGELTEEASLRHAVALLTPAAVLARIAGREAIARGDLQEVALLFRDAKYSARLLAEQAERYVL